MRTIVVQPNSRLVGARCRACPGKVRAGEAVFDFDIKETKVGADDRFALHVDCMRHRVDMAPDGRRPGDPKAQFARLRQHLAAGGSLLDA